jgi:predicted AAA+ superfamily ATPase
LLVAINRNRWIISPEYASVKRQQITPKKAYCIDTGLSNAVGFGFSPNTGNLLENLVFLALRRQTHEIYYCATPGGYEMDFYLPENRQLIQVAHNLDASRTATREREVRALSDALTGVKVESALILSDANENSFELGGVRVEVRSLGVWLLSQ